MADDNNNLQISISDLPLVSSLNNEDRIPVTQGSGSNFVARNATVADIKSVIFHDIYGELAAGETAIELTSPYIFETSTVDVYTNVYGVSPQSVSVTLGKVIIGFKKQDNDLGIKVRIS